MNAEDREIVTGLYPALRRIAAVASSVDIDPDDLVQEALVRTMQKRSLSELDHPLAYLRTAIVNLAANERRRLGRRRRAIERMGPDAVSADVYPSDLDELMALSPRDRALLYLVEIEGLEHAEAARQVGVSASAARKATSRARKKLRLALEAGNA